MSEILKNAVLFNAETLGPQRGSPVIEASILSLGENSLREYLLREARAVVVTPADKQQDVTKLVTSPADIHKTKKFQSWSKAIEYQIMDDLGLKTLKGPASAAMAQSNPWMARQIYRNQAFPHLLGRTRTQAQSDKLTSLIKANGVTSVALGNQVSIDQLLDGVFTQHIAGRTVWVANSNFASKQLGAQIAASGSGQSFRRTLETRSATGAEPFYVTGREVNTARITAQRTGDWTQVHRAYKKHTPKSGQTAVRDITDMTKAMYSYAEKLGMIKTKPTYQALGMKFNAQLFGSLRGGQEGLEWLRRGHIRGAAADNSLYHAEVLKKTTEFNNVMDEVMRRTDKGNAYILQAKTGQGPLAEVSTFMNRYEHLAPGMERKALVKRLVRGQEDILRTGETWQTQGIERVRQLEQLTPDGSAVAVPKAEYYKKAARDMPGLLKLLDQSGTYSANGVNIRHEFDEMQAFVDKNIIQSGDDSLENRLRIMRRYEHVVSVDQASRMNNEATRLLSMGPREIPGIAQNRIPRQVKDAVLKPFIEGIANNRRVGAKFAGLTIGAVAAAGAIWDLRNTTASREKEDVVNTDYADFMDSQRPNGLAKQGYTAQSRSLMTDFGSPYQSPQVAISAINKMVKPGKAVSQDLGRLLGADFVPSTRTIKSTDPMERANWINDDRPLVETIAKRGITPIASPNKVEPMLLPEKRAVHSAYMDELMLDHKRQMQTGGTNRAANKHAATNMRTNDSVLAQDTARGTGYVHPQAPDMARASRSRELRSRMAELQRRQNHEFGRSPINHHRY